MMGGNSCANRVGCGPCPWTKPGWKALFGPLIAPLPWLSSIVESVGGQN